MSETPVHDLVIIEGADNQDSMQQFDDGEPDDLTGYTIQAQIRAGFADTDPVLATLTITTPVPTNGELFWSLAAAETSALNALLDPYSPRRPTGYYDIFVTPPGGLREYLVGGRVLYQPTITRSV